MTDKPPLQNAAPDRARRIGFKLFVGFVVALVVVLIALGMVQLEPGDNYCGRVFAPRHTSNFFCEEALQDRRQIMSIVAGVGTAGLAIAWILSRRRSHR